MIVIQLNQEAEKMEGTGRGKLFKSAANEILALRQRVEELESQALPNEREANRYGLDAAYFRNAINRELNRSLTDFKPDELARVFARLSKTADSKVMFEPEFSSNHDAEVAARAVEGFADKFELCTPYNWYLHAKEHAVRLRKGEGDDS